MSSPDMEELARYNREAAQAACLHPGEKRRPKALRYAEGRGQWRCLACDKTGLDEPATREEWFQDFLNGMFEDY